MDNKNVKLETGMDKKTMLSFLFTHNYLSVGGIAGIIISILAWIFVIYSWNTLGIFGQVVLIFIGLLFIVIKPVMLLIQASNVLKKDSTYQNKMNYSFDSYGVSISQENDSVYLTWDKVTKLALTKNMLAVYESKNHAYIVPVSDMEEDKETLISIVKDAVAENKIKTIGALK